MELKTDFLENQLQEGDRVVFMMPSYNVLFKGTVLYGFSKYASVLVDKAYLTILFTGVLKGCTIARVNYGHCIKIQDNG